MLFEDDGVRKNSRIANSLLQCIMPNNRIRAYRRCLSHNITNYTTELVITNREAKTEGYITQSHIYDHLFLLESTTSSCAKCVSYHANMLSI